MEEVVRLLKSNGIRKHRGSDQLDDEGKTKRRTKTQTGFNCAIWQKDIRFLSLKGIQDLAPLRTQVSLPKISAVLIHENVIYTPQ